MHMSTYEKDPFEEEIVLEHLDQNPFSKREVLRLADGCMRRPSGSGAGHHHLSALLA